MACGLLLPACLCSLARAQDADVPALEDLMKVEVTSVARRQQALADTPAAVFVITSDDIARSGATSIPEALRLAPGVNVSRVSNAMWAVTIRGFNGRFANKLLVMVDGRSVYSPLFSGTLWEAQDTLLEDIDRIEVIRGPGAAMWGANAVNGVINIITKRARSTQGTQLTASAGTTERASASLRHGVALADDAFLRVYAKGFRVEPSDAADGSSGRDRWQSQRAGLRFDQGFGADKFSLHADYFHLGFGDRWVVPRLSPLMQAPYSEGLALEEFSHGASVLARYEWTAAGGQENALQASYASTAFDVHGQVAESRDTFDLEFQQHTRLGRQHDLVWGLSNRYSTDHIDAGGNISFRVPQRDSRLAAAFLHDDITLSPQRWHLILGARFEHDSYAGFSVQPDARIAFTPDADNTLWTSLSRAVRTPSRGERDATMRNYISAPGVGLVQADFPTLLPLVYSDADVRAEKLTQLDFGWRSQFNSQLSIDLAAFYGRYRDLIASRPGEPSPIIAMTPAGPIPVGVTVPVLHDELTRGTTRGIELSADWRPRSDLRLQLAYTHLRLRVDPPGNAIGDAYAAFNEGSAPRRQLSLRGSWDIDSAHRADLWLRSVGALRGVGVPAYDELDLRYAWKVSANVELSVVGQNLLDARHPEYLAEFLTSEPLQSRRGAYLKMKLQF